MNVRVVRSEASETGINNQVNERNEEQDKELRNE